MVGHEQDFRLKEDIKVTSRECVLAAISHEETGRSPVDMGSNPSSGISAMGYNKLKKALGVYLLCTSSLMLWTAFHKAPAKNPLTTASAVQVTTELPHMGGR